MRIKNLTDDKQVKYQHMLRWRSLMYISFFPVGLALMLLLRIDALAGLSVLSWPVQVLYIVVFVLLVRRNDICPWCGKSFGSSELPGTSAVGFKALFRK